MRSRNTRLILLVALGLASLVAYAYAFQLRDLRRNTVEFEVAFFVAFVLYALAVILVLRMRDAPPGLTHWLVLIFAFGIAFRLVLVFSQPKLSDDMYRYVWDGRVQANHINPYAYPPDAPQLKYLRDNAIWPLINRKNDVTVYPAGAELAYAALWRIWPNNVHWFQAAMAAGDVLAGVLLIFLLRALGQPAHRVLIYLWSPLVIFETAQSAHVDGLVLPFLVGAWLARVKGRDAWTGALLGAATALKLYPVLLFPALWRPRDEQGRLRAAWIMPLAFVGVFALTYVPYLSIGAGVIGFLPGYLNENFNMGLADLISHIAKWAGGQPDYVVNAVMAAALAIIGLIFVLRPATHAEQAIWRCIWLIGAFTLLTQNLFPWYMLWLVPLIALFLRPGKLGLKLDAWTGWFLFSGLVALAYTFFIKWVPVVWASFVEYVPLYALLILPIVWNTLQRKRLAVGHQAVRQDWQANT
jgi:alpha-1,6-mannosyltransferase